MKLLLLDKDGTLVNSASGSQFVTKPWDQAPIAKAAEALQSHVDRGWQPVIISNQGGVIAGHKSLESTIAEMRFALRLFPSITEAYFCPDQGDTCWRISEQRAIEYSSQSIYVQNLRLAGRFRKPAPGMLLLAANIKTSDEMLYVGDLDIDRQAAEAVGIPYLDAQEWRDR